MLGVPAGPHPDVFPLSKIIDQEAERVEKEVTLSWTAPGEDFDQGRVDFLISLHIFLPGSISNNYIRG